MVAGRSETRSLAIVNLGLKEQGFFPLRNQQTFPFFVSLIDEGRFKAFLSEGQDFSLDLPYTISCRCSFGRTAELAEGLCFLSKSKATVARNALCFVDAHNLSVNPGPVWQVAEALCRQVTNRAICTSMLVSWPER